MTGELKLAALNFFREGIEEHYSDVTDVTDKNLKSAEMAHYPSKLVSGYKKDYAVVEKLYDKCDAAFEEMEKKEVTIPRIKKAQGAMDGFNTAVMILEESNAMFSAHNKQKTASQATAILILLKAIVKGDETRKLKKDLEALNKKLKTAKRDVTGAKAQRALNLAITGVTMCIPATSVAGVAFVVVATTATRLGADAALGPTGPSTGAAVKTTAGEFAGAVDLVGKGSGKLMSAVGAVDALVSDSKEIAGAEKALKDIQKQLKDVNKRLASLHKHMLASNKTFLKLAVAYETSTKAASDAVSKFKAAKQKRFNLKKELEE